MSNLFYAIVMIIIVAICYTIGLRRGVKIATEEHAHDYDQGYSDAIDWCEETMRRETRQGKLDNLIKELDDLFSDYDRDNGQNTEDHA